jgi:hypothetical protein
MTRTVIARARFGGAATRGPDAARVAAVVEHALDRQTAGGRAAPQQIGASGAGLFPVLEAIEAPVGQAQHAGLQAGQQWLAQFPLAAAVLAEVGAKHGVRGALGDDHATRLRVACRTLPPARPAEGLLDVGLVGQLEGAAVDRHQAQPAIERRRVDLRIGQRHTAALHQVGQRLRADARAQQADGDLAHASGLRRARVPRQPLRYGREHRLVSGLGIQAERHHVVHPGHRRKRSDAPAVAAVRIEHLVHDLRRHHARHEAGAQVVRQPRPRAEPRLGSSHEPSPWEDGAALWPKYIKLTVLRPNPHHSTGPARKAAQAGEFRR